MLTVNIAQPAAGLRGTRPLRPLEGGLRTEVCALRYLGVVRFGAALFASGVRATESTNGRRFQEARYRLKSARRCVIMASFALSRVNMEKIIKRADRSQSVF